MTAKLMSSGPKQHADPVPNRHVHLQIAGEERIERISRAAKSMPWQVLLLELAWTAGPATFIAAAGGYYMGFGKELPSENAVFFLAYTVIFGIIGLVTNLLHRALNQPRKELAQQQLSRVLDRLPDLCMTIRELRFESMDPLTRRIESAGHLLRRVYLDPQTITLLVDELTGDKHLAGLAGKIEMYRRAGLHGRMRELIEECREAAMRATEQLSLDAPETASLLNDRLFGRAPTYEAGLPRLENFIERLLAAIEQDDDKLMTLEDAEQVLMLAFELLSGRALPLLTFEYQGRWETARAMDKLNERWNRYRIAKAEGYSRFKALEEWLANSTATNVTLGAQGQAAEELSRNTLNGIRALNDAAEAILALPHERQGEQAQRLRALIHTLDQALRLHAAASRAYIRVGRRHALFLRNLRAWETHVQRRNDDAHKLRTDGIKTGLQLALRHVRLSDEQKLQLATAFDQALQLQQVTSREDSVVYGPPGRQRRLGQTLAKSLAIELMLKLDELIELRRPEVQRAIYASPVANFHGIELAQSAATKAALGAAAAMEVHDDLGSAAEHLAAVLVGQYQVELSPDSIKFLHRTYGARLQRLKTLAASAGQARREPTSPLHGAPRGNLLGDPEWIAQVSRAQRILKQAK